MVLVRVTEIGIYVQVFSALGVHFTYGFSSVIQILSK